MITRFTKLKITAIKKQGTIAQDFAGKASKEEGKMLNRRFLILYTILKVIAVVALCVTLALIIVNAAQSPSSQLPSP